MEKDTIEYVINILRRGTIAWKGRQECLRLAREAVDEGKVTKDGRKILKFYWKCACCGHMSRDESAMEVDHIEQIGGFKGNWQEFIPRMYCGQENLQALCNVCHLKKTTLGNSKSRFQRKTKV